MLMFLKRIIRKSMFYLKLLKQYEDTEEETKAITDNAVVKRKRQETFL